MEFFDEIDGFVFEGFWGDFFDDFEGGNFFGVFFAFLLHIINDALVGFGKFLAFAIPVSDSMKIIYVLANELIEIVCFGGVFAFS